MNTFFLGFGVPRDVQKLGTLKLFGLAVANLVAVVCAHVYTINAIDEE